MFIDEVEFKIKGGDGGNGVVSFRREKYIDMGGPDGGDGGDGGDIIFKVDEGMTTLADFRYHNRYEADSGKHGKGKNQHGRQGDDLVLKVPPGTIIYDQEDDYLIADLTDTEDEVVAAKGGSGGKGNARFKKATRKAPKFAENGAKGEEKTVRLELKVLADVGLVGYPNVGKSTLISRVSQAKPKIASYHFTTLQPNLGVVSYDQYKSFVMADIPGLIEGAHTGVGLGDEFLRHLERTRLLVHVLDVSGLEGRDPLDDFEKINYELKQFNERLAGLEQIIVLNKIDLPVARQNIDRVKTELQERGYSVFPISAVSGEGVQLLKYQIGQKLEELPEPEQELEKEEVLIKPDFTEKEQMFIKKIGPNLYQVKGELVDNRLEKTDLNNDAAVKRLIRVLKHEGMYDKLRDKGVKDHDTVQIGPLEFEFIN